VQVREVEQFSGINTFVFTIQDVVKEFQEKNRVYLARILVNMARILVNMVDKGIPCKIARDTLIRNFSNLNVLDYCQLRNRP
jgi:hypothetical protein